MNEHHPHIAIIGGGPAGLMAAEVLCQQGLRVTLFDAMPSLGRKFLMAGKSGMNLTHNEPFDRFKTRYGIHEGRFTPWIEQFGPEQIRSWAEGLGIETFVGSSGRIFPTDFKAAPLLRAWLRRLKSQGLTVQTRYKWVGMQGVDTFEFQTPEGLVSKKFDGVILALGSVCWPKLGSDGAWLPLFEQKNIPLQPFQPSNCGFLKKWSSEFVEKFAGHPIKAVRLTVGEYRFKGEFVISSDGVEGSAIYRQSAVLRRQLHEDQQAVMTLDLLPDRDLSWVQTALLKPRGRKSLSTHIQKSLGLKGVKYALLRECLDKDSFTDLNKLAQGVKNLPLTLNGMRPIDEAISCAGGVDFTGLDDGLMIKNWPGVFVAGEMLDWDAPTGGYLLTGCFASGRAAAQGMLAFLQNR